MPDNLYCVCFSTRHAIFIRMVNRSTKEYCSAKVFMNNSTKGYGCLNGQAISKLLGGRLGIMRSHSSIADTARDPTSEDPADVNSRSSRETPSSSTTHIVLIEPRTLIRECLARCIGAVPGHSVTSFPNVERWLRVPEDVPASLILFSVSSESKIAAEEQDAEDLTRAFGMRPTVIISDTDDIDEVSSAIERGARGFIPTSLSLDVMIEALRLVRAGGVFVPASSLIPTLRLNDTRNSVGRDGNTMFTARQVAVVKALSKGKANKIIAHELNMREGTVKVHVRNIMKKLSAKNRTEVALMANRLLQEPASAG